MQFLSKKTIAVQKRQISTPKHRNIICSILLATTIALFLTACESLPPGMPPKGSIVSITTTDKNAQSMENAINDMTTALATCPQLYSRKEIPTVGLLPIKLLDNNYDAQLRFLATSLYRNLNEMDMITPPTFSKTPNYLLSSVFLEIPDQKDKNRFTVFRWEVRLVSPLFPSKIIWKQSINVKMKKLSL